MKLYALLLLLLVSFISYASQETNPYMMPIKINMQTCLKQNMNDCLQSICMASPESCRAQCSANASDKCKMLSGQHLDGY